MRSVSFDGESKNEEGNIFRSISNSSVTGCGCGCVTFSSPSLGSPPILLDLVFCSHNIFIIRDKGRGKGNTMMGVGVMRD